MTRLADGNVLVALGVRAHIHHQRAHQWFAALGEDRFATCPTTQGTLLRVHMRVSVEGTAAAAWEALRAVSEHPRHEWWDDPLDYLEVPHRNLQGHHQVTDAWLAELARRGGRVASRRFISVVPLPCSIRRGRAPSGRVLRYDAMLDGRPAVSSRMLRSTGLSMSEWRLGCVVVGWRW